MGLGLTLYPDGGEIAVHSRHGARVFVCIYDERGENEVWRVELNRGDGDVFRAWLPGLRAGARYGLRVDGPYEPWRGHRFDISKLLVDPYTQEIDRPFKLSHELFERGADTGALTPKSVARPLAEGEPGRQRVAWEDTVLYELNVAGFSKLRPDIDEGQRGRLSALAEPALIEHFKTLGVTTLELMPLDAFVDERHLPPLGLENAWGYNSVLWGCPDPRLVPGGFAEVRAVTDALHTAGLEVVLDVVVNHDGESDEFGPTLSLRGLDNALYFRLAPNDPARYINDMGCGNCVALDRPPVVEMIVAALRRWVVLGGIDGFRFDLATALGRRAGGFGPDAPLLQAIAADPILSKVKLIAEPWDLGPGGYRLGGFPANWGEWNDRFRDGARRFWRGDAGALGDLATRLSGSQDVFGRQAPAAKSINFVVSHDGFTLADLVSYAHKHNEANGENNRDGHNENYSWNHGVEGATENAEINARRFRDQKNLLALTLLARGAPMLAMGAETGHSQGGNNNAYAQANATSWIDWSVADPGLARFVGRLTALRRAHPALRPLKWLTGADLPGAGAPDVEWRDASGPLITGEQWQIEPSPALVAVFTAAIDGGFERVALAFNRGDTALGLALPTARDGFVWRVALSTADDAIADAPTELADFVAAPARSTLVLLESAVSATRPRLADRRQIDTLAAAAGIASEWWEVSGKRTQVSPQSKRALLEAMRLPARSEAQARESLKDLLESTRARRLPPSLTLALDAPRLVPLRSGLSEPGRKLDYAITLEDGARVEGHVKTGEGERIALPDGREILQTAFELPQLPIGRHMLELGGVKTRLTIAPPECYSSPAARRRRFGAATQLYALRRAEGDQGVGDFAALGLAGACAAEQGAAFVGVSPLHALFSRDRRRASPYHPSHRRFLDPMLIDALDPEGPEFISTPFAATFARLASDENVDYPAMWEAKRATLKSRFSAFRAARKARPSDPLFADHDAFVAAGGEALRRFAIFEALSAERGGQYWREWPETLRDADAKALQQAEARLADDVAFTLYLQWLADRQLAGAAKKARDAGLEIGFYRDLAVGSAPDGAEAWARADELMAGASIGAPPDPFSAQGQIWRLPPPDPIAGARDGWRGFAELYGANMRHAGMLRIDHAMKLTRLFVIPDGGKPSEGAYIAYPADDLIGQIALESQRHKCMVIGEDLGTVPDGFREKLTRAHISGMRVLWFERDGAKVRDPADYPALSVACVSTHDLPTLSGWWRGADIGEKLTLGLISLIDAEREIGSRRNEKRELIAALRRAGALDDERIEIEAELTDELAAAFHAYLSESGSALASAQFDDLAAETIATNLPGTDRERPNWRRRHPLDVEALFQSPRAKAILAALAKTRR